MAATRRCSFLRTRRIVRADEVAGAGRGYGLGDVWLAARRAPAPVDRLAAHRSCARAAARGGSAAVRVGRPGVKQPAWAVIGLIELTVLPLALRRSRPVAVLAVTLAAAILGDLLFVGFQIPGPAIALYTVAAHCERRLAVAAAGATALALVVPAVAGGGVDEPIFVVAVYAVFAAAWALGDNLRTRRAYLAELEARAERLERGREETARRAVAEEQARIARELHDVISHNVSVMVVQAAAGGDVFATRPDRAREALGSIESTGREALVDCAGCSASCDPRR